MERPIHLSKFPSIVYNAPYTEPSATVPVWITQSTLDGLCMLINYLHGQQKDRGQVPGSSELIMFYRTILSSLQKAQDRPHGIANEIQRVDVEATPDEHAPRDGKKPTFDEAVSFLKRSGILREDGTLSPDYYEMVEVYNSEPDTVKVVKKEMADQKRDIELKREQ